MTLIADNVMTVREVPDYLRGKDRMIEQLVGNGDMSGSKVGDSWQSRRSIWAEKRMRMRSVQVRKTSG